MLVGVKGQEEELFFEECLLIEPEPYGPSTE